MSITWEEIVATLQSRWRDQGALHQRMIDVRDRYNGGQVDYVLPVSSNEDELDYDPMVPQLMASSIDNKAMRAAEVMPNVLSPALDYSKESGVRSREYSQARRAGLLHAMEESKLDLSMGRAMRHYFAYASFCFAVLPDNRRKIPIYKVMDPLSAYPDPQAPEDYEQPRNIGFIHGKSSDYVRWKWPQAAEENGGPVPEHAGDYELLWDLALWCDEEEWVFGIMGPRETRYGTSIWSENYQTAIMELDRQPHRLENVPFVYPKKVTLDAVISQMGNVTDNYDLQAQLMRLQIAAAEKAVFPDKYVVAESTKNVQVNDGKNQWFDGRSNKINVIQDANGIGQLSSHPDETLMRVIETLERNSRITTGDAPQMSGESRGNMRTGRGLEMLMGEAIDPHIGEAHKVVQAWFPQLNRAGLEMYERYYPKVTYHCFLGATATGASTEFVPGRHVEGVYATRVRYPVVGAGIEATNIILTQMVGSKMMSRRSARARHPFVEDGDLEATWIFEEELEEGMGQSIIQQMMGGVLPPIVAAYLHDHLSETPYTNPFEALKAANERIQAEQAEEAPPATAADPAAQPGIAPGAPIGQPGAPPPVPPGGPAPTIGPPGELQQVREMNNAIRAGNQRIPIG